MRLFATFLCCFLLLMLFGTFSYVYILWHHYWARVEKLHREQEYRIYRAGSVARLGYDEQMGHFFAHGVAPKGNSDGGTQIPTVEAPAAAPRRRATTTTPPLPQDKLLAKVAHYETQIVSQFRNAVTETGRGVNMGEVKNSYHVDFKGNLSQFLREPMTPEELVCESVEQVRISTFLRGDPFFGGQHLDQFFWPSPPFADATFETCGVVSSSGSLKNSGLGARIDSNDAVVRFNNAPTVGHEGDVGTKTSLRIVNSQVVGKPEFKFLESGGGGGNGPASGDSDMYSSAPVLVWDPASYNATLSDWYSNPDYPFFETFFSKRLMRPSEELHLLRPSSLWSIWDWLQRHTPHPLLPNPPSSGFLGLLLALRRCRTVRVYEYVPSMRLTKRCHYYDEEENLGCTVGDWHPLAAEKLLALAMNRAGSAEVFSEGYLEMPGAPAVDCETVKARRVAAMAAAAAAAADGGK